MGFLMQNRAFLKNPKLPPQTLLILWTKPLIKSKFSLKTYEDAVIRPFPAFEYQIRRKTFMKID